MKYYDISVPLSNEMPVWPTNEPVVISLAKSVEEGASSTVTNLQINSHTGTHIDAPSHMFPDKKSINDISLESLMGEVQVIYIDNNEKVDSEELQKKLKSSVKKIIFKTRNSARWAEGKFFSDYVYLTEDGAWFLVEQGIKVVGIDYLSLDKFDDKSHVPHKVLLSQDVVIIEGLDLSKVEPGIYELICLPLKLEGADGAPARVVLAKK
jgi:arylformamidase